MLTEEKKNNKRNKSRSNNPGSQNFRAGDFAG